MTDLMKYFNELAGDTRETIIRAPFGYPGSKLKSLKEILPVLPYRGKYVEPFGGTGVVLFNRKPSDIECYNDRYSGVTSFYLCLQDAEKLAQLKELLAVTVHSREYWKWCKETWSSVDDVDRAFRWFYMTKYSFAQMGRNFGRSTSGKNSQSGMLRDSTFSLVHNRLRNVLIENQSYEKIILDFDSPETVFYMDPPYMDTDSGCYKHNEIDHERLLKMVHACAGYVAISGYANDLYDGFEWDDRFEWDTIESLSGNSVNANRVVSGYNRPKEVLWIKK